ncbi:MAG: hypothetical protein GYA76_12700, partial [Verrucomicrobia bacterium]|nr:hypothetical protein [Verrucomicrobiota bacterium]
PGRKTFIYVNNRLEGNALETLDAMVGLVSIPSTPLQQGPRRNRLSARS